MTKDICNKKLGSGEENVTYALWSKYHIISPRFNTKKELKKWIKENKEFINEAKDKMGDYFKLVQTTEIYANKILEMLYV